MTAKPEKEKRHLMISYQWDSQELVKRIYQGLRKEGVEVWLDIAGGMKGNINAAMAEGVEGAAAICCVMTGKYQASRNCQKELNYADVCAIPIIPVMAQANWKQSGWLGVMTAGALYIQFTDETKLESSIKQLVAAIREAAPQVITGAGAKPEKAVKDFTVEDVIAKLNEIELSQYAPTFLQNGITGAILSSLPPGDLATELGVKKFHIPKIAEAFQMGKIEEKKKEVEDPLEAFFKATSLDGVKVFIESKQVNIETPDKTPKGDTALIHAARRGDLETVSYLIEKKANVNGKNKQKVSALMAASMGGYAPIVKLLIAKGASVNDRADGAAGDSALSLAVYKNHTEVSLALMDAGADVNRVDEDDQDIVLLDAAIHKNLSLISKMIEKKAKVNHQNIDGNTALHNAAKNGSPECVKLLLANGADVRLKNKEGRTALQESQEYQCSKELVSKIAVSPPEENKKFFETPDLAVVKDFLTKFPDSVEIGSPETGDSKLILAARANQVDIVMSLINDYHANVNNPNLAHSSPLMASGMRGFDEIVKFLISKGANINQRTTNLDSPLSLAVWKNFASTAKILIQAGANVSGIDRFGDSMLHDASKNGNFELVQYFLTKAININHQNKEGFSPLHRASAFGHPEIVQYLLDQGADGTLRDNKGLTALQIAKDDRSRQILTDWKAKREAKQQSSAPPPTASGVVLAGGGSGGGGIGPELGALLRELVTAVKDQTNEIRSLRQVVEGMKK